MGDIGLVAMVTAAAADAVVIAQQDAGATAPEIMALGRWASDAWRLYARRERKTLLTLTAKVMLTAAAA